MASGSCQCGALRFAVELPSKWVARCRAEGLAGLRDRRSRPHRLHRPTPQPLVERIAHLRHQRWTGKQIATEVGVSPAPSAASCGGWGSTGSARCNRSRG